MTLSLTGSQIALYLVVLARVGGLVLSAPVLGDPQVPRPVKALVAIVLSVVLVQLPSIAAARVPADLWPFVLVVVAQLLIGLALGFLARLLFFAVLTAGQIVALQMGLSSAAVFNPMTRESDPVLAQLYTVAAVLTFLAVDGDSWLVAALARSFDLAPLGSVAAVSSLVKGVIASTLTVTELGLQIALPIAASLFAANLILGVLSRSLPQLNVFVLSMPLDMLLGLLALIASIAGTVLVIGHLTGNLPQTMLGPLGKSS